MSLCCKAYVLMMTLGGTSKPEVQRRAARLEIRAGSQKGVGQHVAVAYLLLLVGDNLFQCV